MVESEEAQVASGAPEAGTRAGEVMRGSSGFLALKMARRGGAGAVIPFHRTTAANAQAILEAATEKRGQVSNCIRSFRPGESFA